MRLHSNPLKTKINWNSPRKKKKSWWWRCWSFNKHLSVVDYQMMIH